MDKLVTRLNNLAADTAKRRDDLRDQAATKAEATKVDMKSYNQGASVAYTEAGNLAYRQLAELLTKFRNNALTAQDFYEAMGR